MAACPSNPNLVIEAAPVIAGNLCISQSQTMTATVKNTGGAISSQTFSTRFQQNGPVTKCEQKKTGVTLNTNQTTDFSCSFTQAATGAVTLYAQADRSDTGSDDDRIAESNESDNQSPNLSVTFITTPSSAPANMRHTANAETSVTWAWDAVSGATSYNLYKSDDGIEFGSDGSTSSTSKTQTTDYPGGAMAANTKYYYKTRTVNTCGSSGDSAVVSAYTSIQSATGASFSGIGQTSFTVAPSNTISAPNPNTGAYTSYIRFELHNGSDIGCTAALLQDSGWKNTASHTFSTGLSCNTAYKVCIQTRNGDGDANSETGMYQVATSACSQPDLVVPSSPSISGNLCVGQAQTFTSTVRNDGPGNASGTISVPYKEGANTLCTGSGAINLNQTQTNTNFSCNFTPASAGTVLVNATADSTNAITESNESNNISTNLNVTFITTPGAAGTPTFSSIGPTSVAVSWTPGTNATTYNLYRCTGAACSPISLLASNITSPYTDSTVSEGNTYGYQVRDSNSCGNGLNSGTGYVPTPSFTLSNNGPVTVNQSGGTQDVIVTVTSVNSFSSLATLSDNCAASNLSCSWPSGNSCTPLAGSTCTRTLRVGAGTATPGAKTVVVTGTATSYTNKTTNVNVTVSDNILPACSSAQARPDSYSGTGEWDNDTTIYFTWTSSDNVGVTTCWAEIGGTPPDEDAGVGGQDTDTGVAGANTYYVQCQDAALNTCAVISDTIGIDLTAPSCGTPSYNPSGWTNGSVTVTISCSDTGGSGCVQASYSSSPISSNGSGSLTIADNAGNTTSCAYNVTNIDVTAPTISVFTVDGAAYGASANNTDGSPNISWTSSDGTGSGVNNAKIWRAPDSGGNPGAWTNVNTSSSASGSWSDSVSNGTYWYGVHSTDNATNCIKGDTSGVDQGHCGGVTSDALDRRIQRDPVRVVVNAACPLPTYTVTDSVNATYNTSDTVALTWTGATSPTGSYGFSADATCDGTDTYPNSGNSTTVSTTHTDYLCFRNNNACGTTY
ncbi:MAG: CARDB domain-containing protein, partial [Dehalococcoidia bacterium]